MDETTTGRVADKIALVTGGAHGMGHAITRALIAEGAHVLMTDILADEGQAAGAELGDRCRFKRLNVTSADDWLGAVDEAQNAFGGDLSILVNNAGLGDLGTIDDFDEAAYRRVIDVNQIGVYLGIKSALPSMRRAGGGSIVNISSSAGMVGLPAGTAYVSSKFAVRGLTKAAALELGRDGIRVNSVHPGAVDTPMLQNSPWRDALVAGISELAIARLARPEEIAAAVLFLASDEASYITGSELAVDGGWTCQ